MLGAVLSFTKIVWRSSLEDICKLIRIFQINLPINGEKRYAKCKEHTCSPKKQSKRVSAPQFKSTLISLKTLKEEQGKLAKFRETNGMKDAGVEIMRNTTAATGETKVVV